MDQNIEAQLVFESKEPECCQTAKMSAIPIIVTGSEKRGHFAQNTNYQPAARKARGRLVLRLLCRFCVCMCVRTYHVRNNYVTYIVAMRPYSSQLRQFRQLLCVE